MVLAQRLGLPEVLARLLAARGIKADNVDGFLEPRVKHLMPDPLDMVDMTSAAGRIGAVFRISSKGRTERTRPRHLRKIAIFRGGGPHGSR